ncbi:Short-chain dehydrogenase [Tenacibaculum sp. MAR_2009_124]|uniref:SDR family oxidoreductase n=1 Tax=Tenacibaculum sp. MAR_2009_124 TaxID=1250059 RepID=UPI00089B5491|nr:SDR family oxidoreductase [Tenacibaculum sp. MAR_2009_124]SEC41985.1 Short-chain dehydrogenase [Tenacibaculum sp. MAR_2009_124]
MNNQVIWITGASSGIGKSLAIAYSKGDVKLILSSRNEEALNEVRSLCKNPDNVKVLPLDLEQYETLTTKTTEAIKLFSKIDLLINNGGISQRSLIRETSLEVDQRIMAINYLGNIALTKALLPHFIKNQKGHFVVTSSVVGKFGTPLRSSYSASKHALHGFYDALRAEHFKDKITVSLVCPGFVATEVSKNALVGDGSKQGARDTATEKGMHPDRFAKLMIKAIKNKKAEVYIGGAKEKVGVYARRYLPTLYYRLVRKWNVT